MLELYFPTYDDLHDAHYERLLRFSNRLVRDKGLAEDVVSETFLHALEHEQSMEGHPNPIGYIYIVLKNKVYNVNSKTKRAKEVPLTEDIPLPSGADNLDEILTSNLTQPERNLIILHYQYRYTTREIASMLGIGNGACRMRISRVLRKLRKTLEEDPDSPYYARGGQFAGPF